MHEMNEVDEKVKMDPAAIGLGLMMLSALATAVGFVILAVAKWVYHAF